MEPLRREHPHRPPTLSLFFFLPAESYAPFFLHFSLRVPTRGNSRKCLPFPGFLFGQRQRVSHKVEERRPLPRFFPNHPYVKPGTRLADRRARPGETTCWVRRGSPESRASSQVFFFCHPIVFGRHLGRPVRWFSAIPAWFMCPLPRRSYYRDCFRPALFRACDRNAGLVRFPSIRKRCGGYGYEFNLANCRLPGLPNRPPLFFGNKRRAVHRKTKSWCFPIESKLSALHEKKRMLCLQKTKKHGR